MKNQSKMFAFKLAEKVGSETEAGKWVPREGVAAEACSTTSSGIFRNPKYYLGSEIADDSGTYC